jgi:hypothetical protein
LRDLAGRLLLLVVTCYDDDENSSQFILRAHDFFLCVLLPLRLLLLRSL